MADYTLTSLWIQNNLKSLSKLKQPDPVLWESFYKIGKELVKQCAFVLVYPTKIDLINDTYYYFVSREINLVSWATCELNKNFWKEAHRYETSENRDARLSNIYTSIENEGLVLNISSNTANAEDFEFDKLGDCKVLFNKLTMRDNSIEKEEYDLSKYDLILSGKDRIIVSLKFGF